MTEHNEGLKRMIDRQLEESKKEKVQKHKEISGLFEGNSRLHLVIEGMVQGVGFRAFVKREADKLGIIGWVRNTHDEKVELVAEGPKDKLFQLLELCKKGPVGAHIEKIDERWESVEGNLADFSIIR